MKFFMPDWEDRIDPDFNFQKDSYSEEHKKNPYENDAYSHQIYTKKPPYDGMLLSISNFQRKIKIKDHENGKFLIRNKETIREYLKIENGSSLEVMGDCGAYSYVGEYEPPEFYSVEHVAEIYDKLKFDFGVSPDHMAIPFLAVKKDGKKIYKKLSQKERERRRKVTIHNSEAFMEIINEKNYKFKAIGVAQGYNVSSYKNSVRTLIKQGYDYIALGSLVQYHDDEILKILEGINPLIEDKNLHLFGVLRPSNLNRFNELGVTSFDSASYFRKAWLRSGQNYLARDGIWYSAIRIPYSWNKNLMDRASEMDISKSMLERLEAEAYEALNRYSEGKINIDRALTTVMAYDRLLIRSSEGEENLEARYKKTLNERPWEKCDCEICIEHGIDVVIFRGTNRNKRRGYHNTWVFRNEMMNSA